MERLSYEQKDAWIIIHHISTSSNPIYENHGLGIVLKNLVVECFYRGNRVVVLGIYLVERKVENTHRDQKSW